MRNNRPGWIDKRSTPAVAFTDLSRKLEDLLVYFELLAVQELYHLSHTLIGKDHCDHILSD